MERSGAALIGGRLLHELTLALAVFLLLGVRSVCDVEPVEAQQIRSTTLTALQLRSVGAFDTVSTAAFWQDVEDRTTPLIEDIEDTDSVVVTFLYRGGVVREKSVRGGCWAQVATDGGTDVGHSDFNRVSRLR